MLLLKGLTKTCVAKTKASVVSHILQCLQLSVHDSTISSLGNRKNERHMHQPHHEMNDPIPPSRF
jgi:hypothetical protein